MVTTSTNIGNSITKGKTKAMAKDRKPPKKRVRNKSTGRDYKKEYASYQGTSEQKKNRAKRNAARSKMQKAGKVKKGDGKDVDHKKGLKAGNGSKNLRVQKASKNRSFARTKTGKKKGK